MEIANGHLRKGDCLVCLLLMPYRSHTMYRYRYDGLYTVVDVSGIKCIPSVKLIRLIRSRKSFFIMTLGSVYIPYRYIVPPTWAMYKTLIMNILQRNEGERPFEEYL